MECQILMTVAPKRTVQRKCCNSGKPEKTHLQRFNDAADAAMAVSKPCDSKPQMWSDSMGVQLGGHRVQTHLTGTRQISEWRSKVDFFVILSVIYIYKCEFVKGDHVCFSTIW